MRRDLLLAALLSLLLVVAPGGVSAQSDDEGAPAVDPADLEPVDVNRATLEDLLTIPGMTPELARELLRFRAAHGPIRSWSELDREGADLPAARLLDVRPWLVLGESAPGAETRVAMGRTTTPTRTRDEASVIARAGWIGAAVRWRRDTIPTAASTSTIGGVLRARIRPGVSAFVGDVAPVAGMGLILGLRGSFGAEPPTGERPGASAWRLGEAGDLVRSAPVPGGRFLRGAALDLGGRLTVGSFAYHPGLVGPAEADPPVGPARWHWAMLRGRVAGVGLGAQVARWESGNWLGAEAGFPMGAGTGRLDVACDPSGALRWAFAADLAEGRRWRATLRHASGSAEYVAPLAFDSARAPLTPDSLAAGRNDNRSWTRLDVRVRVSRRTALEMALSGRVDPASLRRAWDRPVGAGTVGVEVTASGGWALAGNVGLETRGAPGPSGLADPPERRGLARVQAAWETKRMRLRMDWSGRIDLERDPAGADNRLRAARDLVTLRGRWRPTGGLWIGGGLSRFDMASDVTAAVYEERPTGQSPSVTVRGRGRRWHLGAGIARGPLECGAWLAADTDGSGTVEKAGGALLRLRVGHREE
jgi:hypothetical protein